MSKALKKVSLGSLSDPQKHNNPLNLKNYDASSLKKQLKTMILIRKAEEKIAEKIIEGKIKCPCHLGIGQEAVACGIALYLRKTDRVFGAHRSHTHFLAMNNDVYGLFAEVLGKATGVSKGFGGSMHLVDMANGFWGSVPIVGATIPVATGAALAAKFDKKGDIAVSYFGDGATEEGGFHESMNLAAEMQLPVLFVCENNLFSSHLHINLRQPSDTTARYAQAHQIDFAVVDGNDLIEVAEVTRKALKHMRTTNRPFYIEAVTYRWRGHVGPSEDIDVGVKRKDDLDLWKKRDPIARLKESMVQENMMTDEEFNLLSLETETEINQAWNQAEADPYPELSELMTSIYAPL